MRQKVAELQNRIVEVVTKDRFAQLLHENAADRTAAIEMRHYAWTRPELMPSSA